jgi:hypothetical protein
LAENAYSFSESPGWVEGANADRNQELLDIDIPSATEVVESICGRMEDRRDTWSSDDPSPLTTPWPVATIKSVTVGSTAITGYTFVAGVLTITDAPTVKAFPVCVVRVFEPVPMAVLVVLVPTAVGSPTEARMPE